MVNPALLSAPVSAWSPARKATRFASVAPLSLPPCSPLPNVVLSAQGAAAGTLATGTVLRGVNPGNLTGFSIYADARSSGTGVSTTGLLSAVWGFNSANWTAYSNNDFVGPARVYYVGSPSGATTIAFRTNSAVIGIIGGTGNFAPPVYAVADAGAGYTELTPLAPVPNTLGQVSTLYYHFPAQVSRTYIIQIGGPFAGIILDSSATVTPVDLRKSQLMVASAGDSISGFGPTKDGQGTFHDIVARGIGAYCRSFAGDGGTGYGQPNVASVLTSLSGNLGTYAGGAANASTARTDSLIASQPDVVVVAAGTNEAIPTGGAGWDSISAMRAVWSRLRGGLPSAVLVCLDPFVGIGGTGDGTSGKYPALVAALDTVMNETAGPWIRIGTIAPTWYGKRADGTTFSGSTGTGPWVTGVSLGGMTNGYVQGPANSNASAFIQDGIHPTVFAIATLTAAATMTGTNDSLQLDEGHCYVFPRPLFPATTVQISVQPAGSSKIDYAAGVTCTYTARGVGPGESVGAYTMLTGVNGHPAGTLPIGTRVMVYPGGQESGVDYYGRRIAESLRAALAAM